MTRYVALLRGVNVGGRNKVSMAALRDVVESLGHTEVATFIQSGNVVFTAAKRVQPSAIEDAIRRAFGIDVDVILRTDRELGRSIEANPFGDRDLSKVHVGFMAAKPAASVVAELDVARFAPDEFVQRNRELYLHLPNGMGRSKLAPYLDRQLKVPTTVRTWKTVTKLYELASGS